MYFDYLFFCSNLTALKKYIQNSLYLCISLLVGLILRALTTPSKLCIRSSGLSRLPEFEPGSTDVKIKRLIQISTGICYVRDELKDYVHSVEGGALQFVLCTKTEQIKIGKTPAFLKNRLTHDK